MAGLDAMKVPLVATKDDPVLAHYRAACDRLHAGDTAINIY